MGTGKVSGVGGKAPIGKAIPLPKKFVASLDFMIQMWYSVVR